MLQFPGCGRRSLLSAGILVALAGPANALDPQLDISGASAAIVLDQVQFTPGTRVLFARTAGGNIDCGDVAAPSAGTLQLDLDGKRYAIVIPTSGSPISYDLVDGQFSLALQGANGSQCEAVFAPTALDLVVIGADGAPTARSRIGNTVIADLPKTGTPRVMLDVTVLDPIQCESFGDNPAGIDGMVTDVNSGDATVLTGIDRLVYRQAEEDGRRELLVYSRPSVLSGVPQVQCSSPQFPFGAPVGNSPGVFFGSGFELRDAASDVGVTITSGWFKPGISDVIGIGKDSPDEATLELLVENTARTAAANVKVREYLRGPDADLLHVLPGSVAVECSPVPADATVTCPTLSTDQQFPLRFDLPVLPAGEGLRLTLRRSLLVPAGTADGEVVEAGYVAFVDPTPSPTATAAADTSLANNARWINFAVS